MLYSNAVILFVKSLPPYYFLFQNGKKISVYRSSGVGCCMFSFFPYLCGTNFRNICVFLLYRQPNYMSIFPARKYLSSAKQGCWHGFRLLNKMLFGFVAIHVNHMLVITVRQHLKSLNLRACFYFSFRTSVYRLNSIESTGNLEVPLLHRGWPNSCSLYEMCLIISQMSLFHIRIKWAREGVRL